MSDVKVPATASGFSLDHAEALGVRLVRGEPPFLAEFRGGGAATSFDGETIEQVLTKVEDWHVTRLRCGAAEPVPTKIEARTT